MTPRIPPAVTSDDTSLILWAESPEEARMFLNRIGGTPAFPDIERIFVAKRSGTSRSNKYVGGEYYVTSNDKAVDVFEQVVASPPGITDLVQWCTCDVMLS
jgi:hypothetical protein